MSTRKQHPQAPLIIRRGAEVLYVHDLALVEKVVLPPPAVAATEVHGMGAIMDLAMGVRSEIAKYSGMKCTDMNDVLFCLRKCPSSAPPELVKSLRNLGAAADFCRHSNSEHSAKLVADLRCFLETAGAFHLPQEPAKVKVPDTRTSDATVSSMCSAPEALPVMVKEGDVAHDDEGTSSDPKFCTNSKKCDEMVHEGTQTFVDHVPDAPATPPCLLDKRGTQHALEVNGAFRDDIFGFIREKVHPASVKHVRVTVTTQRIEVIIASANTRDLLGERGKQLRELTALVQTRYCIGPGGIELFVERA